MADTKSPFSGAPGGAQFGTPMVQVPQNGDDVMTGVTVAQANRLLALADLSDAQLAALLGNILHPIKSLYFVSNDATNPSVLLGFGTWVAYGAGKVPVGFDITQVEFDLDDDTGGEKTHALTSDENGPHVHGPPAGGLFRFTAGGATSVGTIAGANNATTNTTGSSGLGTPHNILQPYIVVRIWKRIA